MERFEGLRICMGAPVCAFPLLSQQSLKIPSNFLKILNSQKFPLQTSCKFQNSTLPSPKIFQKAKMKSKTMNIHHLNTLHFFNVNDLAVSRYFLERERERERDYFKQ
jgi:hypothetical protein